MLENSCTQQNRTKQLQCLRQRVLACVVRACAWMCSSKGPTCVSMSCVEHSRSDAKASTSSRQLMGDKSRRELVTDWRENEKKSRRRFGTKSDFLYVSSDLLSLRASFVNRLLRFPFPCYDCCCGSCSALVVPSIAPCLVSASAATAALLPLLMFN